MTNYQFSNKIAVVSGASSGIGKCIAESLDSVGVGLFCIASSLASQEKIQQQFPNACVFVCDFKNSTHYQDLLDNLSDIDVDILVNCAGIFPLKNIRQSTVVDFDECFNINVKSAFILSKAIGEKMCENGSGRIVNIGSSSAYNGSGDAGIYCASKHALLGLTRSLYKEFSPYGVRVYSVSPGSCQTPMGASDKRQDFSTFITPEEVASVVMDVLKFNGEGIMEEIRINRTVIR